MALPNDTSKRESHKSRKARYYGIRIVLSIAALAAIHVLFVSFPSDALLRNQTSNSVAKHNTTRQDCRESFQNSQEWLSGRRLGNIHVAGDPLRDLIINGAPGPKLKRSICHESSRFMLQNNTDSKSTQYWEDLAFRLSYLAIHEHQHKHARKEAESRLTCNDYKSKNISNFDFECPDAKFLVSNLPSEGIGASLRYGAAGSLLLGLSTDRVVLFQDSTPWKAASCDRHDLQCFFMPISSCVITEAEFINATALSAAESLRGLDDERYKNQRVVRVQASAAQRGSLASLNAKRTILNTIRSLYTNIDSVDLDEFMNKIAKHMGRYTIDHAAALYVMRPNDLYQANIEETMDKIFPKDFDPSGAIGLPIRASDRCKNDICLTFDQYMMIVRLSSEQAAARNGGRMHDTVILTTESPVILNAHNNYSMNASWPAKFIVNEDDVGQNSGYPNDFGAGRADDVMLSTVVALKMQLMSESTVGNCCSGFHKLMAEFLSRGCGASATNHFECLQENENPEFRSCCQYSSNEKCKGQPKPFGGSTALYID